MNKIKPWFAVTLWYATLAIAAVAVYQFVMNGADMIWIGALLAAGPFIAYFMWLSSGNARPRSSRRLPLLTLITLTGLVLAAYGFSSREGASVASVGGLGAALVAAAGFLLFANWYSLFNRPLNRCLARGAPLPVFEATDRNGSTVSSDSLLGKPALLLFFRGNWCPICMAQVKEIAGRYRDLIERGVQVVLISPQPHDLTERVAGLYGVQFEFWVDKDTAAARRLGILDANGVPAGARATHGKDTVLPTTVIVDAKGQILYTDQSDNFRIRPDPERFFEVLASHGY